MIDYPPEAELVEVGPRDGLQNEPSPTTVEFRVELIDRLSGCGLKTIETGSFVSPKWVPAMAGTDEVMAKIARHESVRHVTLVPNMTGLRAAIDADVADIAVFTAASETFSQRNTNCSIDESIERLKPVFEHAAERAMSVRGYVSCIAGCPYEGAVSVSQVVPLVERLVEFGCYEVSLGDTIGVGTPDQIANILSSVAESVSLDMIAVHLHDTYGMAIANILAAMDRGVKIIDSSVSGLGGCPYANGATGNVATEEVAYLLDGLGVKTGVDLNAVVAVSEFCAKHLDRPPASKVAQAMLAKSS